MEQFVSKLLTWFYKSKFGNETSLNGSWLNASKQWIHESSAISCKDTHELCEHKSWVIQSEGWRALNVPIRKQWVEFCLFSTHALLLADKMLQNWAAFYSPESIFAHSIGTDWCAQATNIAQVNVTKRIIIPITGALYNFQLWWY